MNCRIRVVVAAVTLETQAEALALLGGAPDLDVASISVSAAKKARDYHIMAAQNSVTLFSAWIGADN